jgi:hypothetical protein
MLVLFGFTSLVSAATIPEYSGAYSSNLVWSGEVTMASDVLILKGASLTIRAGTQVNVIPAEGTKIDPEYLSSQTELLIRGKLDVQGTAEAPVSFVVKADEEDDEFAWAGITLDRAAESSITHAMLERADIAIRCVESSPLIMGNTITRSRYGIVAQQKSHPEILRNNLTNGEGGIFCWRGSNPQIKGNKISGHDEEALFVDAQSRPGLWKNLLDGNAVGLALYPIDLAYDQVVTRNNHENLRWLGKQGQGAK